ncbi:TMEM175 family protein [Rhodanobacter sp. DHB23]|uniref:TMEM175 family protein n=1 Tax=Rhodanobacter sp. DHB23 TaxID=2775923 RepID=UPI0017825FAE|nr:TMEM175 family protein [Rhodanobacter sp. DHB23]MBD8874228.1 DUF1211 domain-containing protein [Rhodanobacter sp. DHB23]
MSLVEHREGIEAGRLDMFVDGAFAFTLTLLAIGGETIPNTAEKLLHILAGVPAAALCFAQIAWMWHGHVQWRHLCTRSTRTGLLLSLLLVFFALIFVYPLHMVFGSACYGLSGGVLSGDVAVQPNDARTMFVCYGLAYIAMAGTLGLLYRHAARLWPAGTGEHRQAGIRTVMWSIPAAIGLLSALTALLVPKGLLSLAGFEYALLGLTGPVITRYKRRYPEG